MTNYKLRATPDMDTRDCEYVNARIADLLAAVRELLPQAQAYVDVTGMHTVSAIDKAQAAIRNATKE